MIDYTKDEDGIISDVLEFIEDKAEEKDWEAMDSLFCDEMLATEARFSAVVFSRFYQRWLPSWDGFVEKVLDGIDKEDKAQVYEWIASCREYGAKELIQTLQVNALIPFMNPAGFNKNPELMEEILRDEDE